MGEEELKDLPIIEEPGKEVKDGKEEEPIDNDTDEETQEKG